MTESDRLAAVLRGGGVRRYHIERIVGQQTVAEHSWRMVQCLRAVKPGASRELVWAVLHHDVPEGIVGDLPSPAKNKYPLLNEQLEAAEAEVMDGLGLHVVLTYEEGLWLSWLDRFEVLTFALDQRRLGNTEASPFFTRTLPKVKHFLEQLDLACENTTLARRLVNAYEEQWHELTGFYTPS